MRGVCRTARAYLRVGVYLVHFAYAVTAQLIADEVALRTYKPGSQR